MGYFLDIACEVWARIYNVNNKTGVPFSVFHSLMGRSIDEAFECGADSGIHDIRLQTSRIDGTTLKIICKNSYIIFYYVLNNNLPH